jgi:hypothetical protein
MTDPLKPVVRKTVRRETRDGHRQIVVGLAPGDLMGFRPARTRRTYWLPVAAGYSMAAKAYLAAEHTARKGRKGKRT